MFLKIVFTYLLCAKIVWEGGSFLSWFRLQAPAQVIILSSRGPYPLDSLPGPDFFFMVSDLLVVQMELYFFKTYFNLVRTGALMSRMPEGTRRG